jgi:DNA-binding HxlR family transcriptional regulator
MVPTATQSQAAQSEAARSEVAQSEVAQSEAAQSEAAQSEAARSQGGWSGSAPSEAGQSRVTQPRACSIARTLEIVGEKWALLAIREVFLGNRRFDELARRIGAPRDTLAARLRMLVAAGVLERRQYCEHPARFEYHLTESGRDLYPVILSLMQWGDRYLLAEGEEPPMILEHNCGHRLTAKVVCAACGEPAVAGSARPQRR